MGWLERNASLIASPVYTDIIYKVSEGLQAFSLLNLVVVEESNRTSSLSRLPHVE